MPYLKSIQSYIMCGYAFLGIKILQGGMDKDM